ncbi:BREX system P-loop protein BrxC [Lysinibacillus sp. A4]|uniref:BREX system P-loop protein BrxC n=1 Tax=Lysinibacillus sp. A4 TaxID=2976269 RepID=UPI002175EC31|nr:BREX system P-loop protein BrxC [Lysinibacillus sp. A4]MCS5503512.1 BREX system P-loop protein BrxC [Lysinibacillus sp. A4]
MILKDMFLKSIERDIRGVIKVAQTSDKDIYNELDEYVVTQELHKHFSKFYDNYQRGIVGETDKMGVWISGFFGSGKSHFLKILAYLLENRMVENEYPVNLFEDKIKDPLVYANMKKAADIETEVVLFNIDSKSSLDNKSKEDAILRVFMKVFYEHRGYYGDIPGVAEMEKYLDRQGQFEAFKQEFQSLVGESWEERRSTFYFDQDFVIEALGKVINLSEASARKWIEEKVDDFEMDIQTFAKDVKEYIDSKGPNFHLVFLVDEIGQYIGDNRNLMLNLQTLTEDLGTYAEGKVWVMVTSQESIDSIIKVKGDDFSRIQGRFDTRLSLSSISVDEVIKKRILEKQPHVTDKLKAIYPEKSAILKNLISFRESTADLRGYDHEQEFAEVYPFIPYQFKLLQNVFEQVRKHGSSGKHLSEGERSMLSAFKEAALFYKQEEEGTLIPFYAFYDTIKEFLNPAISRVIDGAKENPALKDDEFNIDLLKVLFMIKYVKELPATIDNIATLMVTNIDEDKLQLKEKIKSAVRKLIAQTLIQKNGDYYVFLTDDEQDINREIKQVTIDEDVLKRELANTIFLDLYEEKRFNYSKHYAFPFNQKMDEKNYGNQTSSIGVQIISPLSDHYQKSQQELMLLTSGSGEMLIKLGANDSYVEEMEEALKIEDYRKKKNPLQQPENIQNILNNKQVEVKDRKRRVRDLLTEAIKDAEFYIYGEKVEIKGSSVKEKINAAFKVLVDNVFIKLGYIQDHLDSEKDLVTLLNTDNSQLSLDDSIVAKPNQEAKREVFEFVDLQDQIKKQITVKKIYDRYQNKPYGWKPLDIAALIVELLMEQRIRIRYNSEYIEPAKDTNKIITALVKSSESEKAIVVKRTKVDEALIRTAKSICKDVFNTTNLADDEDGLLKDIQSLMETQISEIKGYKARYEGRKYPGMSLLNKGLEYFEQFDAKLDSVSFFERLKELEDNLLDWEEDIAYVKSFFETNQKELFDKGLAAYKKYEDNKNYLFGEEIEQPMQQLQAILNDPIPYKKIKEIPELTNALDVSFNKVLTDKIAFAQEKVQLDYDEVVLLSRQYGVSAETKQNVEAYFTKLLTDIAAFTDIYKVDATISQSASLKDRMIRIINQDIAQEEKRKAKQKGIIGGESNVPPVEEPIVQKESIKVSKLVPMKTLATEQDVDQYISTLSAKLKQIIKSNKQIEFIE